MALTRDVAMPLYEELLEAGYRAAIVGWTPATDWMGAPSKAFAVTASRGEYDYANSAGVALEWLGEVVDIAERHKVKAYCKTFDVHGYEGEPIHYGLHVDFQ